MPPSIPSSTDILILGTGNAGLSAALSAYEHSPKGTRILIIDRCPEDWAGGNSYFTAGAFRTVHNGLKDVVGLVNNVDTTPSTARQEQDEDDRDVKMVREDTIDLNPYTTQDFLNDLSRVTEGKSDPDLGRTLVNDSLDTIKWLKDVAGVRFQLSFNRQAYHVNGRHVFWGGLCLKTEDGGKGLIQDELAAVKKRDIEVLFDMEVVKILTNDSSTITGVQIHPTSSSPSQQPPPTPNANDQKTIEKPFTISTETLILAAGGFEASPSLLAHHLGASWSHASIRGTPYNTGSLLSLSLSSLSAKPHGDFTTCHSVAWDAHAPKRAGDRLVSNEYTKSGYPLGIMINGKGQRFVDEGVDVRNFTYARFGREILRQPGAVAWQVFDESAAQLLRSEEYRDEVVRKIVGLDLQDLAEKLCEDEDFDGRCREQFIDTMTKYNDAVRAFSNAHPDVYFDPSVKDGLSTNTTSPSPTNLVLPKSNWARPLVIPPFLAVKVTCGITFTFGGLAVNSETAAVISSTTNGEIEGLYCVGEMMGGLFSGNYPGGSGLTSGAVFGRRAGRAAAERVRRSQ